MRRRWRGFRVGEDEVVDLRCFAVDAAMLYDGICRGTLSEEVPDFTFDDHCDAIVIEAQYQGE